MEVDTSQQQYSIYYDEYDVLKQGVYINFSGQQELLGEQRAVKYKILLNYKYHK